MPPRHRNAHGFAVRFAADTLNGVPSIVIGVFIYSIAVLPVRRFSALAGGLALGVMMIPLIMRTTEELLLLVPATLREGPSRSVRPAPVRCSPWSCRQPCPAFSPASCWPWRASRAKPHHFLFTALNNRFFSTDVRQPISTLTGQVFIYATAPYQDWHRQAWAGALVLVTIRTNLLVARTRRHRPDGKTAPRLVTHN